VIFYFKSFTTITLSILYFNYCAHPLYLLIFEVAEFHLYVIIVLYQLKCMSIIDDFEIKVIVMVYLLALHLLCVRT
jgi:hypothetical protein